MRSCAVAFLVLTLAIAAGKPTYKTSKRGTLYKTSKRVRRVYYAYRSGNEWIKHGREKTYYDKGKKGKQPIKSIVYWEHGVKHGTYLEKYPNGVIETSGRYRKGHKDEKWQHFFSSGAQKAEFNYVCGDLHGAVVKFNEKGVKILEGTYKEDEKHGVRKTWHDNGKPRSICTYANGKKEGVERTWYKDGKQRSQTGHMSGVKHGMDKLWSPEGKPLTEYEFKRGEKEGMVRLWRKDGKLKSEIEYKDKKRHGICKEYHPNGKISRQAVYAKGQLHGVETNWYPTGQKRSQTTYRFGKPEGLQTIFYDNSNPRAQYTVRLDKKHGPARFFTKQGQRIANGEYRDDKPFSGTFMEGDDEQSARYVIVTYEQGSPISFLFFKHGKALNGIVTEKLADGSIARRSTFKDGFLHGPETRFHDNRKVQFNITWSNNKADGTVTYWHPNGKKGWEVQFNKGVKDGYEKAWDARGNELCNGVYRMGKPWDGTLMVTDEATRTQIIRSFKNGVAQKDLPTNLQIKIPKLPDIQRIRIQGKNQKKQGASTPKRGF